MRLRKRLKRVKVELGYNFVMCNSLISLVLFSGTGSISSGSAKSVSTLGSESRLEDSFSGSAASFPGSPVTDHKDMAVLPPSAVVKSGTKRSKTEGEIVKQQRNGYVRPSLVEM
jgi:hypothetical protein